MCSAIKNRQGEKFVSHQFLAWAGLHVIGVGVRILQCVATLETKRRTHDVLTEKSYKNVHSKSDCVKIKKSTLTIYRHDYIPPLHRCRSITY